MSISVPADTYRARAVAGALSKTSKGNPQIAIEFELLDGGYLSQFEAAIGQRITWYGYFTDRTTEGTFAALRTCGWATDDLDDLTGIDANEVDLVLVEEADLQGFPRIRAKWINAIDGSGRRGGIAVKQRMDENEARSFSEMMRGYALQSRGPAPAAAPAPAAPAPAPAPARAPAAAPRRAAAAPATTPRARAAAAVNGPASAAAIDPNDDIPF